MKQGCPLASSIFELVEAFLRLHGGVLADIIRLVPIDKPIVHMVTAHAHRQEEPRIEPPRSTRAAPTTPSPEGTKVVAPPPSHM